MSISSSQLAQMGFLEGDVVETIVTTISATDIPNAAPMGVWVDSGARLTMHPYEGTTTAINMNHTGEAVINLTHNPHIFLATAFKEELQTLKIPAFVAARKVSTPRLEGMSGYLEVSVESRKEMEKSARFQEFQCNIEHLEILSPFPVVHSRARCAAIECVIHATRIRALHRVDEKITQSLVSKIHEHHDVVKRIAPESPSATVIQHIIELLPCWTR
ncbi:MAG: DUF447 domain-containing protein [Candidatus Hodarchaeota archaeon]